MKKESTVLTYMESENYGVVYKQENRTFHVVDRNGENVTDKSFRVAADAIDWAFKNYKSLV